MRQGLSGLKVSNAGDGFGDLASLQHVAGHDLLLSETCEKGLMRDDEPLNGSIKGGCRGLEARQA
jgi:hypothetical protein